MKSISQTFREASELLWDGVEHSHKTRFCCYAIGDVVNGQKYKCLQVIRDRLGIYVTVRAWLEVTHRIYPTVEEIQAYRKRWMLALADEFEEK